MHPIEPNNGGEPQAPPPQRIGVPTPIDARSDLTDLPLARPIGGGEAPASLVPIGMPLGSGSASVTVADGTEHAMSDPVPAPIEQHSVELQRFAWTIASELTSGMLSNAARGNATVKDAIALFDHVLSEVRTYVQLSEGTDLDVALGAERQRRAEHSNRFYDGKPAPQGINRARRVPAQEPAKPTSEPVVPAKPAPAGPIMIPRYQDLGMTGPMANEGGDAHPMPAVPPPSLRQPGAPYAPGSMAGSSPEPPRDDDQAMPGAA